MTEKSSDEILNELFTSLNLPPLPKNSHEPIKLKKRKRSYSISSNSSSNSDGNREKRHEANVTEKRKHHKTKKKKKHKKKSKKEKHSKDEYHDKKEIDIKSYSNLINNSSLLLEKTDDAEEMVKTGQNNLEIHCTQMPDAKHEVDPQLAVLPLLTSEDILDTPNLQVSSDKSDINEQSSEIDIPVLNAEKCDTPLLLDNIPLPVVTTLSSKPVADSTLKDISQIHAKGKPIIIKSLKYSLVCSLAEEVKRNAQLEIETEESGKAVTDPADSSQSLLNEDVTEIATTVPDATYKKSSPAPVKGDGEKETQSKKSRSSGHRERKYRKRSRERSKSVRRKSNERHSSRREKSRSYSKDRQSHTSKRHESKSGHKSRSKRKHRSSSRSRNRSISRSRHRSTSRSRHRSTSRSRHRSTSRSKYRSTSRHRHRSSSKSRKKSPSRSDNKSNSHQKSPHLSEVTVDVEFNQREEEDTKIVKELSPDCVDLLRDKATRRKLLEVAKRNAVYMMKNDHLGFSITKEIGKAAGKSVEELTNFCKQLASRSDNDESDDMEDCSSESDYQAKPFAPGRHPFLVKEKPIVMNIRNAPMIKPKSNAERLVDQSKLRELFPVSSGSSHRSKVEIGWVTVEKDENNDEKVFPEQAQDINISELVSTRISAMRKLQNNPSDKEAIVALSSSQKTMQDWALSKQVPGQFTGTTGARILTQNELAAGHQAWARKEQFREANPVSSHFGLKMLQKMGWNPGEGLGKHKEGTIEPLLLDVKMDKKGLHAQEEVTSRKVPIPLAKNLAGKHPVSALVELCSKRKWGPPEFQIVFDSGPDHKKNFLIKVVVNNKEYKPSTATSTKKIAKANAAAACLQALGVLTKGSSPTIKMQPSTIPSPFQINSQTGGVTMEEMQMIPSAIPTPAGNPPPV